MTITSRDYGKEAEEYASLYLRGKGYKIVERNYKTRLGEIDLIAKDRQYLVFIEIKARQNNHFGGPVEAITVAKQHKIIRMAKLYMMARKIESDVRFDVVLIVGSIKSPFVELIQNAFGDRS